MDSSVSQHLETAEEKVVEMQRTLFSTQNLCNNSYGYQNVFKREFFDSAG